MKKTGVEMKIRRDDSAQASMVCAGDDANRHGAAARQKWHVLPLAGVACRNA
jgi:hypothetical protein